MNIETFKSLNLHFEELLFHCNDRMSDHVATAIVCNRANEKSAGSTVKIDRQRREKLRRELIKRREKDSMTLRDVLKEKYRARIVALFIISDRMYGNNIVYPLMQFFRENESIHRRLVFGSLNTTTGEGVQSMIEKISYMACLRNQVDFVLKILNMRNLMRQMHGWKENYGNFVSTSDGKQKRRCAEIKAEKILTDNFGERAVNLLRFWNDCKCSKFGWCDDYSGVNHEAFMTLAFSKRREIAEIKATEYVLDQLPVSPTLCFDSSSSPSSLWLSSSSSSSQSSG